MTTDLAQRFKAKHVNPNTSLASDLSRYEAALQLERVKLQTYIQEANQTGKLPPHSDLPPVLTAYYELISKLGPENWYQAVKSRNSLVHPEVIFPIPFVNLFDQNLQKSGKEFDVLRTKFQHAVLEFTASLTQMPSDQKDQKIQMVTSNEAEVHRTFVRRSSPGEALHVVLQFGESTWEGILRVGLEPEESRYLEEISRLDPSATLTTIQRLRFDAMFNLRFFPNPALRFYLLKYQPENLTTFQNVLRHELFANIATEKDFTPRIFLPYNDTPYLEDLRDLVKFSDRKEVIETHRKNLSFPVDPIGMDALSTANWQDLQTYLYQEILAFHTDAVYRKNSEWIQPEVGRYLREIEAQIQAPSGMSLPFLENIMRDRKKLNVPANPILDEFLLYTSRRLSSTDFAANWLVILSALRRETLAFLAIYSLNRNELISSDFDAYLDDIQNIADLNSFRKALRTRKSLDWTPSLLDPYLSWVETHYRKEATEDYQLLLYQELIATQVQLANESKYTLPQLIDVLIREKSDSFPGAVTLRQYAKMITTLQEVKGLDRVLAVRKKVGLRETNPPIALFQEQEGSSSESRRGSQGDIVRELQDYLQEELLAFLLQIPVLGPSLSMYEPYELLLSFDLPFEYQSYFDNLKTIGGFATLQEQLTKRSDFGFPTTPYIDFYVENLRTQPANLINWREVQHTLAIDLLGFAVIRQEEEEEEVPEEPEEVIPPATPVSPIEEPSPTELPREAPTPTEAPIITPPEGARTQPPTPSSEEPTTPAQPEEKTPPTVQPVQPIKSEEPTVLPTQETGTEPLRPAPEKPEEQPQEIEEEGKSAVPTSIQEQPREIVESFRVYLDAIVSVSPEFKALVTLLDRGKELKIPDEILQSFIGEIGKLVEKKPTTKAKEEAPDVWKELQNILKAEFLLLLSEPRKLKIPPKEQQALLMKFSQLSAQLNSLQDKFSTFATEIKDKFKESSQRFDEKLQTVKALLTEVSKASPGSVSRRIPAEGHKLPNRHNPDFAYDLRGMVDPSFILTRPLPGSPSRCSSSKEKIFTPSKPQELVMRLMDPSLVRNKGVLLDHDIGTGKTCAGGIGIGTWGELASDSEIVSRDVLLLLPRVSLISSWVSNIETCSGLERIADTPLQKAGQLLVFVPKGQKDSPEKRLYVVIQVFAFPLDDATVKGLHDYQRIRYWKKITAQSEEVKRFNKENQYSNYSEIYKNQKDLPEPLNGKNLATKKSGKEKNFYVPTNGLVIVDEAHLLMSPSAYGGRNVDIDREVANWLVCLLVSAWIKILLLTATPLAYLSRVLDVFKQLNLLKYEFETDKIRSGVWRAPVDKQTQRNPLTKKQNEKADQLEKEYLLTYLPRRADPSYKEKLTTLLSYYSGLISFYTLEFDFTSYPRKVTTCDSKSNVEGCYWVFRGQEDKNPKTFNAPDLKFKAKVIPVYISNEVHIPQGAPGPANAVYRAKEETEPPRGRGKASAPKAAAAAPKRRAKAQAPKEGKTVKKPRAKSGSPRKKGTPTSPAEIIRAKLAVIFHLIFNVYPNHKHFFYTSAKQWQDFGQSAIHLLREREAKNNNPMIDMIKIAAHLEQLIVDSEVRAALQSPKKLDKNAVLQLLCKTWYRKFQNIKNAMLLFIYTESKNFMETNVFDNSKLYQFSQTYLQESGEQAESTFGFSEQEEEGKGRKKKSGGKEEVMASVRGLIREFTITIFNDANNDQGQVFKVLFGDISMREGISLCRVHYVHMFLVPDSLTDFQQIAGRALRFCSHQREPNMAEWTVRIFLYFLSDPQSCRLPASTDDDCKRFQALNSEGDYNDEVLYFMRVAALDCALFGLFVTETGLPISCGTRLNMTEDEFLTGQKVVKSNEVYPISVCVSPSTFDYQIITDKVMEKSYCSAGDADRYLLHLAPYNEIDSFIYVWLSQRDPPVRRSIRALPSPTKPKTLPEAVRPTIPPVPSVPPPRPPPPNPIPPLPVPPAVVPSSRPAPAVSSTITPKPQEVPSRPPLPIPPPRPYIPPPTPSTPTISPPTIAPPPATVSPPVPTSRPTPTPTPTATPTPITTPSRTPTPSTTPPSRAPYQSPIPQPTSPFKMTIQPRYEYKYFPEPNPIPPRVPYSPPSPYRAVEAYQQERPHSFGLLHCYFTQATSCQLSFSYWNVIQDLSIIEPYFLQLLFDVVSDKRDQLIKMRGEEFVKSLDSLSEKRVALLKTQKELATTLINTKTELLQIPSLQDKKIQTKKIEVNIEEPSEPQSDAPIRFIVAENDLEGTPVQKQIQDALEFDEKDPRKQT